MMIRGDFEEISNSIPQSALDSDCKELNKLLDRDRGEIFEELNKGKTYTVRLKTPVSGSIHFKDMIYGDIVVSNSEIDDFIIARFVSN